MDNGAIRVNQECVIVNHHDPDKMRKVKVGKLYEYEGLNKVEVTEAGIRRDRGHFRYYGYSYR